MAEVICDVPLHFLLRLSMACGSILGGVRNLSGPHPSLTALREHAGRHMVYRCSPAFPPADAVFPQHTCNLPALSSTVGRLVGTCADTTFARSLPPRLQSLSAPACPTIAHPHPIFFGGLCTIPPRRSGHAALVLDSRRDIPLRLSPRSRAAVHRDPTSRSAAAEWPRTRTSPPGPSPSPM